MDTPSDYRRKFADMVGRLGEDLDLALAALYIAAEDGQSPDIDGSMRLLDQLAQDASLDMKPATPLPDRLQHLALYLGVKEGFSGNKDDYYNPNNSYLNRVLETRTGIPITLSLIYMEVGNRLGIPLEPVGLPGHLVLRAGTPKQPLFLDPFHRGRVLSPEDCQDMMAGIFGRPIQLTDAHFEPISRRQFIIRLLTNLKGAHAQHKDYSRALAAADRISLVDPHQGNNLKERAWLFREMGQFRRAISDLQSYLKLQPQAEDAKRVEGEIESLWKTIATLN